LLQELLPECGIPARVGQFGIGDRRKGIHKSGL
jgi:hypothetical protein